MYKDKYELNVLVNGKPVREFFHQGKFYIEARENSEYSIKLKNHSHKRIMAVFSVDGIDVLKGGQAKEAESGYIIEPYSHVNINGYRIDDNNVATFKFDDGKTSYSTQVEYKFEPKKLEQVKQGVLAPSKNNGIIGVRIWEEKEPKLIPAWKSDNRHRIKGSFYGYYNGDTSLGVTISGSLISATGNLIGNIYSYSGCMPSTIRGGIYASGCGSSSSFNASFSYNPMNVNISSSSTPDPYANIDWNEWELDINRTDVNQFGNLEAISSMDFDPPKLRKRNRTLYQSEGAYVGPVALNYTPNFSVGTTWGQQVEDKIVKVNFEKADAYIDLEIFYLKREELIKLGIDFENNKKVFISGWPEAFGEKESYCKKPLDWRKS